MISFKSYILLHILLINTYVIQIFSDILLINDKSLEINLYVKNYYISNFVFDILLLLFLVVRLILTLENKKKYDSDYFIVFDFWTFLIGSCMYYIGIICYYSYQISYDNKRELNKSRNFQVYFYCHLPLALIYISIVSLVLFTCLFLVLIHCFGIVGKNNKIFPS